MGDDLLGTIIAFEKELQREVQAEASRATAWRERQLAAMAREEQEARAALEITRDEMMVYARAQAAVAGEQDLVAIQSWASRLKALPDEHCRARLAPLLRRLLPEAGDDHPHGQN